MLSAQLSIRGHCKSQMPVTHHAPAPKLSRSHHPALIIQPLAPADAFRWQKVEREAQGRPQRIVIHAVDKGRPH